jgi:hypothetical protein
MSDDDIEQKLAQLKELERRLKELEARPPINVSGDYVGGNSYTVGDITGGVVAIGSGARASSNEQRPAANAQQPMGDPRLPYESRLRQQMVQAFSLDELRLLCDDLGINPETIGGATLEPRAMELIAYCKRLGLLEQLVALCRQRRPHLTWE